MLAIRPRHWGAGPTTAGSLRDLWAEVGAEPALVVAATGLALVEAAPVGPVLDVADGARLGRRLGPERGDDQAVEQAAQRRGLVGGWMSMFGSALLRSERAGGCARARKALLTRLTGTSAAGATPDQIGAQCAPRPSCPSPTCSTAKRDNRDNSGSTE
jgi:hypothetical protein